MKTLINKSVIIAALAITFITSSFKAEAQNNNLVYDKTYNASIGITVENAIGASYMIKDISGNIVLKGKVKSDKTFYIPTSKLVNGSYRFFIGSLVIQEFVIK
jgi:hypothetical protein